MRTQGDDIAEILALIGCRPVWDDASRRVTGFEVVPLAELGRPRIDVTVRISGFFRDAFPHVIALLDDAIRMPSPSWTSPPSRTTCAPTSTRTLAEHGDRRRATARIFGSKPGAYGAGLLPLIDARNWRSDADLAEVYAVWGGYAYGRGLDGREARADMEQSFRRIAVAAKNQDTREHDIVDSDDYFQYHGGMVAMVRALTGRSPAAYVGDSAVTDAVKTRTLAEETKRVFRARVVNPKWIAAMQRHGYKGAFELAATVDYLFGYDATAGVVDDWMYGQLAAELRVRRDQPRVHGEVQPVGAARDHRAAARGRRPRHVGQTRRRRARPAAPDLPRPRGRPGGRVVSSTLVGVGVGPGDPELVTVKAANLLAKADVVFVPVSDTGETGRAEQTVLYYAEAWRVERVVFALHDREHTEAPRARVGRGGRAGGRLVPRASGRRRGVRDDRRPVRLLDVQLPRRVRAGAPVRELDVQLVPGITAMQDLAARSGTPLVEGREPLALFPMTAGADRFREALERGDAVAAYKFGRMLPETLAVLRETGRLDEAVYGAGLGLPEQDIRPASELNPDEPGPYLSTLIVPPKRTAAASPGADAPRDRRCSHSATARGRGEAARALVHCACGRTRRSDGPARRDDRRDRPAGRGRARRRGGAAGPHDEAARLARPRGGRRRHARRDRRGSARRRCPSPQRWPSSPPTTGCTRRV